MKTRRRCWRLVRAVRRQACGESVPMRKPCSKEPGCRELQRKAGRLPQPALSAEGTCPPTGAPGIEAAGALREARDRIGESHARTESRDIGRNWEMDSVPQPVGPGGLPVALTYLCLYVKRVHGFGYVCTHIYVFTHTHVYVLTFSTLHVLYSRDCQSMPAEPVQPTSWIHK